MKYGVRIILDEIEVEAGSKEEAQDIASDIFESDARSRLDAGLSIIDFEIEELE